MLSMSLRATRAYQIINRKITHIPTNVCNMMLLANAMMSTSVLRSEIQKDLNFCPTERDDAYTCLANDPDMPSSEIPNCLSCLFQVMKKDGVNAESSCDEVQDSGFCAHVAMCILENCAPSCTMFVASAYDCTFKYIKSETECEVCPFENFVSAVTSTSEVSNLCPTEHEMAYNCLVNTPDIGPIHVPRCLNCLYSVMDEDGLNPETSCGELHASDFCEDLSICIENNCVPGCIEYVNSAYDCVFDYIKVKEDCDICPLRKVVFEIS